MGLTSATAPVVAILHDDLFIGEAEGYLDRTGKIDVHSAIDQTIRCVGRFAYTGSKTGTGTMQCNDGNEARFSFNALSMLSGYGYGKTSRGALSFTFGLTPDEAGQYLRLPQGRALRKQDNGGLVLTPL
ncbi:MAG: hypothetical protein ACXWCY_31135 [Burkholderiales bacterium]